MHVIRKTQTKSSLSMELKHVKRFIYNVYIFKQYEIDGKQLVCVICFLSYENINIFFQGDLK